MEQIKIFYERDPEKYKPILQKFFTGFDPSQQEQIQKFKKEDLLFRESVGRENEPDRNSIPGMIQAFQMKYSITSGMRDRNQLREILHPSSHRCYLDRCHAYGNKINNKSVADFVQFGMSLTHPFARCVLEAPQALLLPKDRMRILKSTRYRVTDAVRNSEQFIAFDMRKVLGYEQPKNPKSFIRTLEYLKSLNGGGNESIIEDIQKIELYSYLKQYNAERLDFNNVATLVPVIFLKQDYGFSEVANNLN